MPIIITSIIFASVIILDQLTKYLVVANMSLGQSVDIIPGILRLTYIRNDGAAFGMLDSARWIFMSLTVIALAGIVYALIKYRKEISKPYTVALALILGGGFSNMIDRCFFGDSFLNGTVIDFIDFCAFPKIWSYIFNVADSCVVIGGAVFVILYIISTVKSSNAKKSESVKSIGTDESSENVENVENAESCDSQDSDF